MSIFTLFFWAYGGVDMFFTLTGNEAYLKDFPPQMIVWIQEFPVWRKMLWGFTVLLGTLGGVMLLMKRAQAPALLWGATMVALFAFVGHDILMAEGVKNYGHAGIITASVMIALGFVMALHASMAIAAKSRNRQVKR